MIWKKRAEADKFMHVILSNIRDMEGTKGGWFVVTIIFYKQSYQYMRT